MVQTFTFTKDIGAFAKRLGLDYAKVVTKLVVDLDKKIVLRTPVDTGWARMNWNISAGEPDLSVSPPMKPDPKLEPDAAAAVSLQRTEEWTGIIMGDPFHVFYISNGIPYIEELEGGYSKQAPAGMVAVSLAEVEAEIL